MAEFVARCLTCGEPYPADPFGDGSLYCRACHRGPCCCRCSPEERGQAAEAQAWREGVRPEEVPAASLCTCVFCEGNRLARRCLEGNT